MSGVFGIIDPEHREQIQSELQQMSQRVCHLPWHRVETMLAETAGIGLGRVVSGIFNPENQPAFSEDKSVAVLVSGELYGMHSAAGNLPAGSIKSRPAAEILLDLYEQFGEAFIPHLEGIFQMVIWDGRKKRILLANDRFGLYPLYYARLHQGLVFAPEMNGVLGYAWVARKIDPTAIAEYVRFQCLLGRRTFFDGLSLLPAANILTYSLLDYQLTTHCYWDFSRSAETKKKVSYQEAAYQAGELLGRAVRKRLEGGGRPGIYLSGGLDSRVILGMGNQVRKPMTTVTYGQPGCRDVIYANQLARKARTDHHFFEIQNGDWVKEFIDLHFALTEGFHSWIHAHGISILGSARLYMDVNLNGLNGAELNWDDPKLYEEQDEQTLASRLFTALTTDTTWPSLNESEELLLFDTQCTRELRGEAFNSLRNRLREMSQLSARQKVTTLSFEVVQRLFLYYTVFNRSHIEQRYPFYDEDYLNYVHSLPVELLLGRRLRREVLRKYCAELISIPYAKDGLPVARSESWRDFNQLVQRGKKAFNRRAWRLFPEYPELYADYETWLRTDLRGWGEALLLGEQTLERGIFNPDFLRALWSRFQNGTEANLIGKIAPLMTLEMVFRKFLT